MTMKTRTTMKTFTITTLALALTACTVGPDYRRPESATPANYKENENWKPAQPADDISRGAWWRVYGDADLDALEDQVKDNQTIAQSEAQYRGALALVDAARANYFPVVSADAALTRSGGGSRNSGTGGSTTSTSRSVQLSASWEIDLWGRVRRQVESQRASADASASDLANITLSVQAQVAASYFQLRQVDTQKQLLQETIAGYQRTLDVTRNRYAGGVSGRVDVAQAETQLKTTQVQAIDLATSRGQLEHAIALLLGKPPAEFSIPVKRWTAFDEKRAPAIPAVGVPSELLQRRPDIAGAERRVASANAQIGVAKAAYFPSLSLAAAGGFSSTQAAGLFTAPFRFWSIGPSIAQTIFDGGLRSAQTAQAIANYDGAVAVYRQAVLNGFTEVEDQLIALRTLEQEATAQDDALASAREALALTFNQYKAGTIPYTDVVTIQATALSNERNAVSIFGSRMVASVNLVKATGGGWDANAQNTSPPRPAP